MDETAREEFKAALAIRHTPGLGARTWKRLLERYGSAIEAALNVSSWTREGLAMDRQAQAFRSRAWREPAAAELEAARTRRLPVVLWTDPRYPARLKEIHDPPLFLYACGRLDLLTTPGVAVVGARQCSRHGLAAARRIAGELSRAGLTVISGLALGIDREAHLGGLESVGSSIAVLGTGLEVPYPESNGDVRDALAEHGLIVTELPPSTMPAGPNFPIRNRIISGLSLGVLVVEAPEKSGSLITARLALEQGREVFALSGPVSLPSYTGCHALLEQGATLVQSAEDILRELAPLLRDELRTSRMSRTAPSGASGQHRTPPVAVVGMGRPGHPESRAGASEDGESNASSAVSSLGVSRRRRIQPKREREETVPLPGAGAEARPEGIEGTEGGRSPAPSSRADARSGEQERLPDMADMASMSLDERAMVTMLAGARLHFDELCRRLDWEASKVGRVLVGLEVLGAIRKWPGMYYTLV